MSKAQKIFKVYIYYYNEFWNYAGVVEKQTKEELEEYMINFAHHNKYPVKFDVIEFTQTNNTTYIPLN